MEAMALKRDGSAPGQPSQVKRALGAPLGKVEGAFEREAGCPSPARSRPQGCPGADCGEPALGRLGCALPGLWEGGATVS